MRKITVLLVFMLQLFLNQTVFCQHEVANKKLVQRYFAEVVNQQKIDLLKDIFSENYFFKSLEDGSENRGIKQLYDFLPYFFKAFPDINYTVDQIVAEGDKVVVQTTARGTQKGDFAEYPASNNKINVTEIFFFTIKDGKISESRRLLDLLHFGKQLKGEK